MPVTDGSDVPSENADGLALRLAKKATEIHEANVGLSVVTPASAENAAPGTIVMGICCEEVSFTKMVVLQPGRERMRNYSVISVLDLLRKTIAAGFAIPSTNAHQ